MIPPDLLNTVTVGDCRTLAERLPLFVGGPAGWQQGALLAEAVT